VKGERLKGQGLINTELVWQKDKEGQALETHNTS